MALQSQQHTNLTVPQLSTCQVLPCFRAGFARDGHAALLALLNSTDSRNSGRSPVTWQHQGCQTAWLPLMLLSLVPPAHQREAQVEPGLQVCSRIRSLTAFPAGRDSSETHPAKHTCHPGEVTSQDLVGHPPPPRQPLQPSGQAAPGDGT